MGPSDAVWILQKQEMSAAWIFLSGYNKDGNKLLVYIVTGDQTWVLYIIQ